MEVELAQRGLRVAVYPRGEGPPVLWIPGSGADHLAFGPAVRRLSHRFTCWLYDPRGTGRTLGGAEELSVATLAEDARALLDALGLAGVRVVGHSLGTRVALELCRLAPGRVIRQVLWAPWHRTDAFLSRQMSLIAEIARALPQPRAAEYLLWLLTSPALQNREPERFRQTLDGMFLSRTATPWPQVLRYLAVAPRSPDPEHLEALPPTLVVAAAGDRMVPPEYARALFAALPSGRGHAFHLLEGERASHLAHVEMPDAFAQQVERFLAEEEGGP